MEQGFYSRSTGKLKSTSHSSYTTRQHTKRHTSSVYSIEDEEDDSSQYPTKELSLTQIEYIEAFVSAMCPSTPVKVDPLTRAIHWVGSWRRTEENITVSCTMLQPHITLGSIGLSGMYVTEASNYASQYATVNDGDSPSVLKNVKYCRVMGKHAIPFVDGLIKSRLISKDNVSWNNVVLSLTQPIFCVIFKDVAYECKLSHISCKVMSKVLPASASVSPPVLGAHNYTFRCSQLRGGGGTGPSVTVHSSGIIQFQGKPTTIKLVVSSFRDCIDSAMTSSSAMTFLRSLVVLRKFPIL